MLVDRRARFNTMPSNPSVWVAGVRTSGLNWRLNASTNLGASTNAFRYYSCLKALKRQAALSLYSRIYMKEETENVDTSTGDEASAAQATTGSDSLAGETVVTPTATTIAPSTAIPILTSSAI